MDLAAIKSRLAGSNGRLYWRSLGELADTPEFREYLHREFPEQASEWNDPKGRRNFLKLMSASLALAGVGACTKQPPETLVPYVRQPEDIVPGRPLYFASAVPMAGTAMPVLVESHMGRPTKIEGNPEHPASRGGTDVLTQASVLNLYDPDRAKTITFRGEVRGWPRFVGAMQEALRSQKPRGGAGLHFLAPPITSPSLAALLGEVLRDYPAAKLHHYDAVARPGGLTAAAETTAVYQFDKADVIVALDADFLTCGAGNVRYSKDFSARRRLTEENTSMNRLYAIESTPTLTGAKADHRLSIAASEVEAVARELAAAIGGAAAPAPSASVSQPGAPEVARWVAAIAKDLQAHKGRSVVVAGEFQTDGVHAAAKAINDALGNTGTTVLYGGSAEAVPASGRSSIVELARAIDAGQVELLVIMGGNPVFTAPVDLRFADRLAKVPIVAYHTTHLDETSPLCHWNVAETHALESWGDSRSFEGTVTVTQPLIEPLYEGQSAHDFIAAFTSQPGRRGLALVKDFWTRTYSSRHRRLEVHESPRRGLPQPGGVLAHRRPRRVHRRHVVRRRRAGHDADRTGRRGAARNSWCNRGPGRRKLQRRPLRARRRRPRRPRPPLHRPPLQRRAQGGLEIIFRPDPTIWDGRFANNGWLQELPKPYTKVTWDPTAWISKRLADERGLRQGDVVELRYRGNTVRMPVFVVPGHPAQSVTVFFGYGRRNAGRVGNAVGSSEQFNAFLLRTSDAPWFGSGLELVKTGEHYPLATTQQHHSMEGRAPVRTASLEEYKTKPDVIHHQGGHTPPRTLTMLPDHEYNGYKWGMAIDLSACTGCSACVVACTAENNIPVIGKDQVLRSREMQWIRIDHYFSGDPENPESFHQPMLCQQCENAPCEVVCPVAATTHSSEGLNDMVYNRCVGTRYCSNNCPYKVRRFNFLLYSDWNTESLWGVRNPDVTVRSRGVMEKCTYCVQRINQARIDAKREDRRVRDGEIVPACGSACPADAIVFGDMNDPEQPGQQAQETGAELRRARGPEHPSAHDLPGGDS